MAQINYQQMLSQAQNQYSGILAGYDRALASQQQANRGVTRGYNRLTRQTLRGLEGSGEARSQEIADYYTQRLGGAQQDLISRGLGNSTITGSVARGFALDEAKAQTGLANQLAGQAAQYRTQIGLAGLGQRGEAAARNTALMQSRLGYQGDWQRALLGAGLQGAGMDRQDYGRFGGGGSVSSGRPFGSRESVADYFNRPQETDDPYIDLNAGLYDPYASVSASFKNFGRQGGGGGASQWEYAPQAEYGNEAPGYTYDWTGAGVY